MMRKGSLVVFVLVIACTFLLCGCKTEVENEAITIEFNGNSYDGHFTGTLDGGVPVETGKFVYGEKDKEDYLEYKGNWENGKISGEGELYIKNYSISYDTDTNGVIIDCKGEFSGKVLDGIPNGNGTFAYGKEGAEEYFIYDGDWKDGKMAGKGILKTSSYHILFNGDPSEDPVERVGSYKGETLDGLASGKGDFTAIASNNKEYTYSGEWENGTYNGEGIRKFKENGTYSEFGNFEKGEWRPSLADFILSMGTNSDYCPYSLSDEAYDFIKNNKKLFKKHKAESIDESSIKAFDIGSFKKNANSYDVGLVKVNGLTVLQAMESVDGGIKNTLALAYDYSGNYYWLYYIGTSKKYVENNVINPVFLPIGYSTYKTIDGGEQWAISGIIAY